MTIQVTASKNATVKVHVYDTFERPVPGAAVVLKSDVVVNSGKTDVGGNIILNVAAGEYSIYSTQSGYYSTTKTITLNPTPGSEINEVNILLIEDNILAIEVTVTDVSGTIVDYVEAGVEYHFEVTYYVKGPAPVPDIYIPEVKWTPEPGWQVAPESGPITPVVVTDNAVYIPSPKQDDIIVTMVMSGEVHQMKQIFDVEARIYNKGGMTIEDVTTQVSVNPPQGFRLFSDYPSMVSIGNIPALEDRSTSWLFAGDAAGDYVVTVDADGFIFDTEGICHKVHGSGSATATVDPLAILSFEFPGLAQVTAGEPIDWTIQLINNNDYPAYAVKAVLKEFENIGLAPGEVSEKWIGDIPPNSIASVTYSLVPTITGQVVGRTVNVTYPTFGVNVVAPELVISSESINFSDVLPTEEDEITITAIIQNLGNGDVFNVAVQFYDGDPLLLEKIREEQIITSIAPLETKEIFTTWIAEVGEHDIYCVVDPANSIFEFDETNNKAFKYIYVKPLNQPPSSEADGPYEGFEGSPVTFDGSGSSDPDGNPLQYRWDFDGDAVWDTGWGPDPMANYTWQDDFAGTAQLEVGDGQFGDLDTASVTILNVAPEVEAGLDQMIDEGDAISFEGSFTDPGQLDTHTIVWDFGDSGIATEALTPTHSFIDDGAYPVKLTVTDDDGGIGSDVLTVTVNNVPPAVDAGVSATINEGESFSSAGYFTDPGDDIWTATIDYGDASGAQDLTLTGNTFTFSHTYADNGTYIVTVTVSDDDDGVGFGTATVSVNNIAPNVSIDDVIQPYACSLIPYDVLKFYGSFFDPGKLDTHEYKWDFGNGDITTGTLTPSYAYSEPGSFTVTLTITDNDGGVSTATVEITIKSEVVIIEEIIDGINLLDVPAKAEKEMDKAVVDLNKAIDEFNNYRNEKGFHNIAKGVKHLEKAQDKGADTQDFINDLVDFVLCSVYRALDEAYTMVGPDNHHVIKAQEHYNKALGELADGIKYDKAIKELRKAYKEAMKARGEWVPEAFEDELEEIKAEIQDMQGDDLSSKALTHMENAEAELTKALEEAYDDQLDKALDKIKKVINELDKAMDEGADTAFLIELILESTEDTLYQKITDAELIAGAQNKDIVKARENFDSALAYLEDDDYNKAIDSFKTAVKNAENAMK